MLPAAEWQVPHFHFQVRTDTHVLLTDGAELADTDKARVEAACRVGDLLKEHASQLWVDERLADGRDGRHRPDPFRHKRVCNAKLRHLGQLGLHRSGGMARTRRALLRSSLAR